MITLMTRPIVLIALAALGLALPQAAKAQIVIFRWPGTAACAATRSGCR